MAAGRVRRLDTSGLVLSSAEDHQLKSLSRLIDIYYESVGATPICCSIFRSIAPAASPCGFRGIMEWRRVLDAEFAHDLSAKPKRRPTTCGRARGSAAKAVDGRADTYWATDDGVTAATLCCSLSSRAV
ncbi:MAG: hypothetical protein ACLRM8_02780 [Alistipes sp.]